MKVVLSIAHVKRISDTSRDVSGSAYRRPCYAVTRADGTDIKYSVDRLIVTIHDTQPGVGLDDPDYLAVVAISNAKFLELGSRCYPVEVEVNFDATTEEPPKIMGLNHDHDGEVIGSVPVFEKIAVSDRAFDRLNELSADD